MHISSYVAISIIICIRSLASVFTYKGKFKTTYVICMIILVNITNSSHIKSIVMTKLQSSSAGLKGQLKWKIDLS